MESYILDFLAARPIYGSNEASMTKWKADCMKDWASILEAFLNTTSAKKEFWTAEQRQANIISLLNRPQVEQRTDAWYTEAQNLITASQFSLILKDNLTRGKLVMEKASGKVDMAPRRSVVQTIDLNPFTWGIRFEPVVNMIYCHLTKTEIKDMGRLKHQNDPRLAASPDGMVVKGPPERYGRFVEFKAPVTRKLTQEIPKDYVVQMQIQMEVGNVEECDYLEVKFNSAYESKLSVMPTLSTYYGEIYIVAKDDIPIRYEYSTLNTLGIPPTLQKGETLLETVPWTTSEFYLTTVERSRSWFASVQPKIDSFYKDIESAKKGTFVLPETSRKRKDTICMIVDEVSK
jgi:hypothetical protein